MWVWDILEKMVCMVHFHCLQVAVLIFLFRQVYVLDIIMARMHLPKQTLKV